MSAHNYHPGCGCSDCCDSEADDERREEYIAEFAPAIAKRLVGAEDFAWDVLVDEPDGAKASILQDVGRFFERFHKANDDHTLACIAGDLYRDLLPYVEAAAKEQAETEVAAEYDRSMAA